MPVDRAALPDRSVIAVSGADARDFLQRLVTNDVEALQPGQARYAALLTPQGKIITDFFVVAAPDAGLLLDVPAANAADLAKRLTMYRLRAKVLVEDRTSELGVAVFAGQPPSGDGVLAYADPRDASLWARAIMPQDALPAADAAALAAYAAQRIRAGVPEGGLDFSYGDVFPHDANLDHLAGVDFRKGCYVGQEVVSRVQHRGTARKRIVPAAFDGDAPPAGADLMAGEIVIGTMGSSTRGHGLALVRLDRADEIGGPVTAAGVALRLGRPAWA